MAQNGDGKLPYFAMYPKDFLGDEKVKLMKPMERAFYCLLLLHSWLQKPAGTLPTDDAKIAKLLDLTQAQWQKIKEGVLSAFYFGEDGRWHQKRMEGDYQKNSELRAVRASAGQKGGASKARNLLQQKNKFATARASDSDSDSDSDSRKESGEREPFPVHNPNAYPSASATYIDRKNPPFPESGIWKTDRARDAVKLFLRQWEDSHGKKMKNFQFCALLSRCERWTPDQLVSMANEATSNDWKKLVFPDERPTKSLK